MIWNYIKTIWRTIKLNPFYSGINILGLTLGLSVGFLILLWIQHELAYNRFDGQRENIYKVNSNIETNGRLQVWPNTPGPVAAFAREAVSGVAHATRIRGMWEHNVYSVGDEVYEPDGAVYVDVDFFSMFQTQFKEGVKSKPFIDNYSVVITRSLAEKMFGKEPAIGKTISGDFKENYTVSGVIEDLPENSSVAYSMFFPMSIVARWYETDPNPYWESLDADWGNFNYTTYLQTDPGVPMQDVRQQLADINAKHDRNAALNKVERAYELQAIDQINLYQPDGTPTGAQRIRIFSIVALLTLVIACINYINLSTARATTRAKEVSMRKIVGAASRQLFFQFIWESCCFILLAVLCSLGVVYLSLPWFNTLIGDHLEFSLKDASVWRMIAGVSVFILIASSIYPAILLSGFKPLQAIKGRVTTGISKQHFRPVLVTVQFLFSAALIVGTLVIGNQLNYLIKKDPGYNREQVFTFSAQGKMAAHMETVKAQLAGLSGVEDIALADQTIYSLGRTTGDIQWEGMDPNAGLVIKPFGIDASFITMMDMKIVAGKGFSGSKLDSAHVMLNESAVKAMGLEYPVGKRITLFDEAYTVLGVLKDFNYRSLKYDIEPVILYYNPIGTMAYIKTSAENTEKTLAGAKMIWKQYNGRFPFHYRFMDEGYQAQYRTEQITATLFRFFSGMAVVIACLGLFGLATYSSKVRVKEIGIRKVVGASPGQITMMLSLDFLRWVVLALILAFPLAYFIMQNWLENFYYRIDLSWSVFALSALLVFIIAILTISLQALRAALANPVHSLRDE